MLPFLTKSFWKYYPPVPFEIDLRQRLPRCGLEKLRVLNVGVGVGNSSLARQLPYFPFAVLDHLDVHLPYLKAAKSRSWAAKHVGFIEGSIADFKVGGYDVVLMFDVLEHLKKEHSLQIIASIHCRQIIFIPLEKEFRPNVYHADSQDHLSLWTEADFIERGYKTEVLTNFHSYGGKTFDALWAIK